MILHLVVNGIDAMAGNRDRPRELTIRSQWHDDHHVTVDVQDTGVGIEHELRQRRIEIWIGRNTE
jgi:signal transduction histidine kinase